MKWFLSVKGENPWEDVHSVACYFVVPASFASVDEWNILGLIPFVNVIFPISCAMRKKCRKRGIVIYHYRNVRRVFVEPVAAER